MDIDFDLKRESDINLYTQLYEKLKEKILKGELKAHSKLPAIRNMAQRNNVNPATVVKAYDLLERDELIYKKVGSGSYVSPTMIKKNINKINSGEKKDSLELLDYGQLELSNKINFASATPSPSFFPVEDFKYAINSVLNRDKGEAFSYQKSQGYYPLREYIKNYLSKVNIRTKINNIQIVSGAQQAIDLLAKVLLNYGDKVIVERPTYTGALSAFRTREASVKGISMQKDGMDLNKLEAELQKSSVRFIYIMTSFQNPTGITWSEEKKLRLLELAQKYDFLIIEDDCLSELYFNKKRPESLMSYDKEGRIVYIKSFSKIFMPGLRLAFTVLPENLLKEVLAAKHATDISSAGITQRAFDFYLREGLWEKHLSEMRSLFKKRFTVMQKSINRYMPEEVKESFRPEGGLYFWLQLPNNYSSEKLYEKSLERGIAFLPGSLFLANREDTEGFRLSFASVNSEEIKLGIKNLGVLVKEYLDKNENRGFTPLV